MAYGGSRDFAIGYYSRRSRQSIPFLPPHPHRERCAPSQTRSLCEPTLPVWRPLCRVGDGLLDLLPLGRDPLSSNVGWPLRLPLPEDEVLAARCTALASPQSSTLGGDRHPAEATQDSLSVWVTMVCVLCVRLVCSHVNPMSSKSSCGGAQYADESPTNATSLRPLRKPAMSVNARRSRSMVLLSAAWYADTG